MEKLQMIGVIDPDKRPRPVPADGVVPEGWAVKGGFMFPPNSHQTLLWEEPKAPVYDFTKIEDRAAAMHNRQVAMPAFNGYPESLVRELQAAFEHTCTAVGLEVVYDDALNLSKNLHSPTGRAKLRQLFNIHDVPKE